MRKLFFSIIILGLLLGYIVYLSGLMSGITFLFSLVFYYLIFYIFHIFWSLIFKKVIKKPLEFSYYFVYRISLFILFIFTFFFGIIYYENYYNPALLPEFTITNNKKTVVFQGMAHIGSEKFYSQIKENIRFYKNNGYTLFFEGVKPGTKEESEEFDKLLGINLNKDTYTNFSKLYNLKAQNNNDFLNIVNNKDVNVDIGISDILKVYKEKFGTGASDGLQEIPVDVTKLTDALLNELNNKELDLFVKVNRAIMNMIIKNSELRDSIVDNSSRKDIFSIILDHRNSILANRIIKGDENKIYVLYGLMHFDGVMNLLQSNDSNWNVVSARFFKPID